MSHSLVLVINSGSSSLKFALIDAVSGDARLTGLGECFGLSDASVSWKYEGEKASCALDATGNHHQQAIERLVTLLEELGLKQDIIAIGHRVVHGGERFSQTVKIDAHVLNEIDALSELAPLHNPAHVIGIRAAMQAFPYLPQYAVFDTAFHQTMPAKAYHYALPQKLYQDYGIRRYGFHGTSHYFVSQEAAKQLGKSADATNVITVHLGNGASICAVREGKSVDTSMGFTPTAGLMMGTRCGDLDPGIIDFLMSKGWNQADLQQALNKEAGFLGVSGLTSDCRGIVEAMEQGHEGAKLAFEIFTYRVAKYIASYMVSLDELDAIVFTGGIGENSLPVRSAVLKHLKIFGYREDTAANEKARFGEKGIITKPNTPIAMVIPTNEEWVIAKESMALLHA
ncbi:acetate/propionate family kinase (plasmid) [Photobacterium sp. GJ3]|uniref:acetate/propionate family kinase n=1 Tax=Photobacterium sp. GJ3 TaxID=2829502 RepID=UPI001B8C9671|nr:acetate/propionate family kinase [Photobacterium sp. GJ3]QUJ69707.1 acetate/propionate family kinase [Photobacterium sp. GJ3]